MQLLINVGGKGTRMGDLTMDLPKPMVKLCGKPILEHLVEWGKESNFDEIILLCGYKHEIISDYFADGSKFGIKISYSIEQKPLGSGGPIKFAKEMINDKFGYISGDLLCKINFANMLKSHKNSGAIMTILLHTSTHPEDSDILKVDENNRVVKFISKHDDHTDAGDLGNAGLCIIEPEVIGYMKEDKFTFETYLYPELLNSGEHINAYITEELICDIGTPERLNLIENKLMKEFTIAT